MKKILLAELFIAAVCGFAFAKSRFPELEKVREIKQQIKTAPEII